ncbi:MAG TPA: hypothetical protein VN806_11925, partial [Caulobacteraceae bacterium]|nr:hypothetical protein [Caulobacteraceae bacterium]
PWISTVELFDTAFEQIRHYAASDAAVSLRLLRAFGDIVLTAEDPTLGPLIAERARRIGAGATLEGEDMARLRARLESVELLAAGAPPRGGLAGRFSSSAGASAIAG